MLGSICVERRDPDRGLGVQHISEIVPLVLAKIDAAETRLATENQTRVKPSPLHLTPVPGVLAEA